MRLLSMLLLVARAAVGVDVVFITKGFSGVNPVFQASAATSEGERVFLGSPCCAGGGGVATVEVQVEGSISKVYLEGTGGVWEVSVYVGASQLLLEDGRGEAVVGTDVVTMHHQSKETSKQYGELVWVGVGVGCGVLVIICVVAVVLCCRKEKKPVENFKTQSNNEPISVAVNDGDASPPTPQSDENVLNTDRQSMEGTDDEEEEEEEEEVIIQSTSYHPHAPDQYQLPGLTGHRPPSKITGSASSVVFDRLEASTSPSLTQTTRKRSPSLRSMHRSVSLVTPPYTISPQTNALILDGGGPGSNGLKNPNTPDLFPLKIAPPRPYSAASLREAQIQAKTNWL